MGNMSKCQSSDFFGPLTGQPSRHDTVQKEKEELTAGDIDRGSWSEFANQWTLFNTFANNGRTDGHGQQMDNGRVPTGTEV